MKGRSKLAHWGRRLAAALLLVTALLSLPAASQDAQPDIKGLLAALPRVGNGNLAGGLSCSTEASLDLAVGRDGVFFSLPSDLREIFALSEETKSLLTRFSKALASRGVTLVAMPIPTRGIVQKSYLNGLDLRQRNYDPAFASDEFAQLISDLQSAGIVTADVLGAIETNNAWSSFYYLRDNHWTTSGAKLAAQAVASALLDVDIYGDMPKQKFETTPMATVERKDRMALDIQRLCHRTVPGENDTSFTTAKVADASAELPDSALVGSTFSATPDFNFNGFLQEQSGVAFVNYAVATDDPVGSIASLLTSESFRNAPPPIVVWEIPPGYNIDLAVFRAFRQVIPAVYGACEGDAIVASSDSVSVNGQSPLLELSGQGVHGSDYYVHLEASAPGLQGLGIAVTYPKSDADVAVLGSFSGAKNGSDFYYQLADEFDGDVEQIILTGDTGSETVKLTVCKAPSFSGT